jgi:hypothetical protein
VLGLVLLSLPSPLAAGSRELIAIQDLRPGSLVGQGATAETAGPAGKVTLRVRFRHGHPWPAVNIKAPRGPWDLAAFEDVLVDVRHVAGPRVRFGCRLDSPGAGDGTVFTDATTELRPGATAVLRVPLRRRLPTALAGKLFGMRGYPGGYVEHGGIDTAQVVRLTLFAAQPRADVAVEVRGIRVAGRADRVPDAAHFFPLIDRFGQYRHRDWPGKIHTAAELARRRAAEAADLAAHPGPDDWDRYGGWQSGPALEATGYFRVTRHAGKWWLVDPDGRLFWSHGIDGIGPAADTPISDRRHWFEGLPGPGSPLAAFYGRGRWAPHGYYRGKTYDTYNFAGANLRRKYGAGWPDDFADLAHRRLRSWGMNTVGNWSDPRVYVRRRTPYVVAVHAAARPLEGSGGYWGKFPDVFDPGFRRGLRAAVHREKGTSAGDPWCLGYIIDNELPWGEELSLAAATLSSPADQPAKKVFVADLKRKYGTVEALNRAWGTRHASWTALLNDRRAPDAKKADDDLAAFATKTAEEYFRVCRAAVKEVAPHQLYLGCRFAWVNDRVVRAAGKYCDVLSYNRYEDTVADFRPPAGVDLPVVIGEFHFGALDRGLFHAGLRPVADQRARGAAYRRYVRGALANPWLVGTHWFQFVDQPATGRGDGENYQIGFVDVCDTPYAETVAACRLVGYGLYRQRVGER